MAQEKFVKKTITIRADQEKYVDDKCINLSRFVQKKLDGEIPKSRTGNAL